ncbi:MAG: hypothetical protein WCG10_06805, partial [Chlamydiota bacterium]
GSASSLSPPPKLLLFLPFFVSFSFSFPFLLLLLLLLEEEEEDVEEDEEYASEAVSHACQWLHCLNKST